MVGLFGGFAPKIEKSTDIGTVLVFSPSGCLISPPSKPSGCGITLLDFLGGDNTVGPSRGSKSEFLDSRLGAGLGSLSGAVGKGAEVKYLNKETEISREMKDSFKAPK